MIRLIQRRLIIPRGDTGSFTIPTRGTVEEGDVAVFSLYDALTHKTVFEKIFKVMKQEQHYNMMTRRVR